MVYSPRSLCLFFVCFLFFYAFKYSPIITLVFLGKNTFLWTPHLGFKRLNFKPRGSEPVFVSLYVMVSPPTAISKNGSPDFLSIILSNTSTRSSIRCLGKSGMIISGKPFALLFFVITKKASLSWRASTYRRQPQVQSTAHLVIMAGGIVGRLFGI